MQYLEARLVALAAQAKRCVLENGNAPALPSMSEADCADAEGFLAETLLCFPLLGLGAFSVGHSDKAPGQTLFLRAKGIEAQGHETPEGFVVRGGSTAVKLEVPSCHAYICELREALAKNGVLKSSQSAYTFTQDYVFASPSTAAGVIQGRSANGRVDWKSKDGRTLKEIQESVVAA